MARYEAADEVSDPDPDVGGGCEIASELKLDDTCTLNSCILVVVLDAPNDVAAEIGPSVSPLIATDWDPLMGKVEDIEGVTVTAREAPEVYWVEEIEAKVA